MTLLGDAAVAMWWDMAEANRIEFHEWHSKEHLPERLSIPGFRRGSRWQQENGGSFFVLYELDTYEVLTSEGYLARLNDPTPWSTKMMPLHLGMTRSQCRVLASAGRGIARYTQTVQLSPRAGEEARLAAQLNKLVMDLPKTEGITGAHLLRTETPAAAPTREQQIRGGDAAADWILLISGHDAKTLSDIADGGMLAAKLVAAGASEQIRTGCYQLVHVLSAADMNGVSR